MPPLCIPIRVSVSSRRKGESDAQWSTSTGTDDSYRRLRTAGRRSPKDLAESCEKVPAFYFAAALWPSSAFVFLCSSDSCHPYVHLLLSHCEVGNPGGPFPTGMPSVGALYLSGHGCVQQDFCPFSRSCGGGKYLACLLLQQIDIGIGVAWVMVEQYESAQRRQLWRRGPPSPTCCARNRA